MAAESVAWGRSGGRIHWGTSSCSYITPDFYGVYVGDRQIPAVQGIRMVVATGGHDP